ncbi:hypothetical protein MLD38_038236 [Melastoma candidum]|uniref:Uncharacterized protein n=1 Tax=Melastoma candidum TaxID=119954 RepID=A0ACB9KYB6_9MYRT|nr:hypothetical protein MLD38_038236 [Melastoma candidum]
MACLAMRAVVVLAVLIFSGGVPRTARDQGLMCRGNIGALAIQCGPYVQNGTPQMDPSRGCCEALEQADVQCMCEWMPAGFENVVDMDKVSYVCHFCGRPLDPGSRCGGGN